MTAVLKPTGSPAERFTSTNPDDFAVPRGREEEWRFTPVRLIRDVLEPYEHEGTETVTVDAPEGVRHELVGRDHPLFGSVARPADRVAALAFAGAQQALLVEIDTEAAPERPVVIDVHGKPGRNYGHVIVHAGRFSRATVIFDHTGQTTDTANVEFVVDDGASLSAVSVQDWDAGTIHISAHSARVGRDATFRHVSVGLGSGLVRLSPTVTFAGPGGRAELLGVALAGDDHHVESRLFVDHGQPNCSSNVLYKNALLGDSARTVWIGDVRIRPTATGTDTYEMNRNLLLSDGARADSVPNLEIETGDIAGAGHASATGRFDDLQLFYLQARGIPEDEARRLVVRGFFADVVERIGLPDLQHRIMTAIESRLGFTAVEETEDV
ncbi:MAG: Fe-S cluster assembly protein SufD [Jatrophihabitans sp.]|uniref:Fe-S cluster assembly protein SufD n=1 Tax=Jatrophihabitans sp. TaxID=1932789 RepID=UPI003F7F0A5E